MFGKRRDADETSKAVAGQVTDFAASANTLTLGMNTAYSLDQSLLAHSQAHAVLFSNMISEQQQFIAAGQAASIKMAADLYGIRPDDIMPSVDDDN